MIMKTDDTAYRKNRFFLIPFFILFLIIPLNANLRAETTGEAEKKGIHQETQDTAIWRRVSIDLGLNAYYSCLSAIVNLTDKPIPDVGEKSEFQIYKDLLKRSYLPRFILFEASVNPLPLLGVFIKSNYRDFYDDVEFNNGFNVIKAVTAGFEEPFALSMFLGNIVNYIKPGEKKSAGNNGYMGYLFSAGNYHIKDNTLISDSWYEIEWKIKGDQIFETKMMNWSFRVGTKRHEHSEIADIYYVALRRSRLDFEASSGSIWENSGFSYVFDISTHGFDPMRHYVTLDKKWPFKGKKIAFKLDLGFIWESNKKYSGSLSVEKRENTQVFIRPNIIF